MENNNGNNLALVGLFGIILTALVLFYFKQKEREQEFQPQPIVQAPVAPQPQPLPQPPVQPVPPPVCPHDIPLDYRKLYVMGYDDSSHGRRPNQVYQDNIHYIRGYRDGQRFCPPGFFFQIGIK